jgi:subtilisin-like proprotein convertase family protein
MRKLLLVWALCASAAFSQTQTFTYSYSGLPLPIAPDDWDTWSIISLFVPKSIVVTKVTASVTVQYSGVGDLNVFLWSPAGTRSKLLERNCGSLQNIDTTFDDSAPSMFRDVCPQPGQGPFRGNEPLSNSVNENGFGFWRLGVENNGRHRPVHGIHHYHHRQSSGASRDRAQYHREYIEL